MLPVDFPLELEPDCHDSSESDRFAVRYIIAVETTWRGVPSSDEFLRRSSDGFRFPFDPGENVLCVRCVDRRERTL